MIDCCCSAFSPSNESDHSSRVLSSIYRLISGVRRMSVVSAVSPSEGSDDSLIFLSALHSATFEKLAHSFFELFLLNVLFGCFLVEELFFPEQRTG